MNHHVKGLWNCSINLWDICCAVCCVYVHVTVHISPIVAVCAPSRAVNTHPKNINNLTNFANTVNLFALVKKERHDFSVNLVELQHHSRFIYVLWAAAASRVSRVTYHTVDLNIRNLSTTKKKLCCMSRRWVRKFSFIVWNSRTKISEIMRRVPWHCLRKFIDFRALVLDVQKSKIFWISSSHFTTTMSWVSTTSFGVQIQSSKRMESETHFRCILSPKSKSILLGGIVSMRICERWQQNALFNVHHGYCILWTAPTLRCAHADF